MSGLLLQISSFTLTMCAVNQKANIHYYPSLFYNTKHLKIKYECTVRKQKISKVRCHLLYSNIQMSLHNHEDDNLLAQRKTGSTNQDTECI